MLRVVVELDDIGMLVGGFQKVRLRAPAHLSDQPRGLDGHGLEKGMYAERNSARVGKRRNQVP